MKKIDWLAVFIKDKSFCFVKDNAKWIRKQVSDWEKISAKHTSDEGLLFKICKVFFKVNNKKTATWNKKWAKEDMQMAIKTITRHSTSYTIRQIWMKTKQWDPTYTPIFMVKSQNTDNTKCWWDVEQEEFSFAAGRNTKRYSLFRRQFRGFL